MPVKGFARISGLVADPLAQNFDVGLQVAGRLRQGHAAIPDQFYHLELYLAAELASLHPYPSVP